MSKKLSKQEIINRLKKRNNNNPNNPVYLYPKNQPYEGQSKPLQFRCSKKHIWVSTAERTIFNERGCPECKKINERNNKRTSWSTAEKSMKMAHNSAYEYKKSTYINYTTQMEAICPKHGSFLIVPLTHAKGKQGCPDCIKEQKQQHSTIEFVNKAKIIHNNYYDYTKTQYVNTYTKVEIGCPTHGTFSQRPADHLNGHGCPACVDGRISRKQLFWLEHISQSEGIFVQHAGNVGEFAIPGTKYKADGYCKETNTVYEFHGDAFHGNPSRYQPNDRCHPFKKHLSAQQLYHDTVTKERCIQDLGYNLVVMWEGDFDREFSQYTPASVSVHNIKGKPLTYVNHKIPELMLDTLKIRLVDSKFMGYKHKHMYMCLMCGSHFNSTLTQRKQAFKKYGAVGCPSCSKQRKYNINILTEIQRQVGGIIDDNILHITNNLSIFIKDLKPSSRNDLLHLQQYHNTKSESSRLVPIFVDELGDNMELIVNKLKHYTNQNNLERIHARKCSISVVTDRTIKRDFLNTNHIQGNDNSQIAYGAWHEGKLVAMMTFTKPRVALGYKNKDRSTYDDVWELSRFTTDINTRVPGIASKLLKAFQRDHPTWSKIISYADARWSVGNLYDALGFTLEKHNPPDYFYVVDGERKHRWNYRKDILKNTLPNYNPELTEYQNMKNHGYWRVWDCGTMRYVLERTINN